jgi:hypothetical protein
VIANYCKLWHMVKNHNTRIHAPISLKETWATSSSTHHLLDFLLAITEVILKLRIKYKDARVVILKCIFFLLAYNKIYDSKIDTEGKWTLHATFNHCLATVPQSMKILQFGKRVCSEMLNSQNKMKYKGCQARIQSYCNSIGVYGC